MLALFFHFRKDADVICGGTEHIWDILDFSFCHSLVIAAGQQVVVDIRYEAQHSRRIYAAKLLLQLHDFLRRNRTQFFQRFCTAKLHKFLTDRFCLVKRHIAVQPSVIAAGALENGFADPVFRQRRAHKCLYTHASCGLTEYGDVFRVAAECCDIFFYPFQRRNLIENRIVSASSDAALLGKPRVCQESEGAETIVDRYQNHTALAVSCSVKFGFVAESMQERAAVNPECNRQFFVCRICRCPDI